MSELLNRLLQLVETFPEVVSVIQGETRYQSKTIVAHALTKVDYLKQKGLQPGDRVAIMLYNQVEFLVYWLAARGAGLIPVPINLQMLPQDIAYVIQHAGVKHIVVAEELVERVSPFGIQLTQILGEPLEQLELPENVKELSTSVQDESLTSLSMLMYTSGTTGFPKGVMLSEANLLSNIDAFLERVPFTAQERVLMALPMFHAYGFIISLAALLQGATLVLVPKFQPRQIVASLVKERVTILPLVPTFFTMLLDLIQRQPDLDLSALQYCVSGGAALPEAILRRVESALNVVILEGYGLTETSPVVAVNCPKLGSRPGTVGPVLKGVNVLIREDGEIAVKGPNVMAGYYNNAEETEKVLTEDGWFLTGDLGTFDDKNCLIINGRKKDLIIKAGENLSPRPIEEVLSAHPAVQDCCVLGLPDEKLGERVVATVSLLEGADADKTALMQHCRQFLDNFYVPDEILILPELPKNATGKVVKKVLKEQLYDSPLRSH